MDVLSVLWSSFCIETMGGPGVSWFLSRSSFFHTDNLFSRYWSCQSVSRWVRWCFSSAPSATTASPLFLSAVSRRFFMPWLFWTLFSLGSAGFVRVWSPLLAAAYYNHTSEMSYVYKLRISTPAIIGQRFVLVHENFLFGGLFCATAQFRSSHLQNLKYEHCLNTNGCCVSGFDWFIFSVLRDSRQVTKCYQISSVKSR